MPKKVLEVSLPICCTVCSPASVLLVVADTDGAVTLACGAAANLMVTVSIFRLIHISTLLYLCAFLVHTVLTFLSL